MAGSVPLIIDADSAGIWQPRTMDISINISRTSTRTATLLSKERAQLQLLRGHLFTLAQDLSQPLRMLSDWTGDQINPVFDKDTFSHEFEILGVEASRQTVPQIQRLTGEVMVKKFVDNVSSLQQLPPFGRTYSQIYY